MTQQIEVTVLSPPKDQFCPKCYSTKHRMKSCKVDFREEEVTDEKREHYRSLNAMAFPIVEVRAEDVDAVASELGINVTELDGERIGYFNDMRPDVVADLGSLVAGKEGSHTAA